MGVKIILAKSVKPLADNKREYLEALGLSNHEILTYTVLVHENRNLTVQEIASRLFVFPSALYRILSELDRKKLIFRVGTRPLRYKALPEEDGLQAAFLATQADIAKLLAKVIGKANDAETRIIVGRQATYDEYVHMANDAEKEITIYAIGIAYTDKLHDTQRAALKRGLKIRHVVQQHKPANYHVIHKWLKLGVGLRFLKADRGFHFTQTDRKVTLITFSNPANTDERLSILTKNPLVAELFSDMFEKIWLDAKELEI